MERKRLMTHEEAMKIKVYSHDEMHLLDNWEDYAHTLDPEGMSPDVLKEIDKICIEKELNTITLELLELIKEQYRLNWHGTHGVIHWHRVYLNGIKLSSQEGVNTRVLQLFSIFHDSQRKNEHRDKHHGKRGAELAIKLRKYCPLDDAEFALLIIACELHTNTLNHENITVQACFDSDRLDLGRVGNYPDPERLCTQMAKEQMTIEWAFHRSINHNDLPEQPFGLRDYWEE